MSASPSFQRIRKSLYAASALTRAASASAPCETFDSRAFARQTAVVRSQHMPAEEIEYLRWKAERWMKLRHMHIALWQDPCFVIRHGPEMLAKTG